MGGGCRPGGCLLGRASLASAIGASNPLNFEHKAALYWHYQSHGFALIRDKKCEWASAAALRHQKAPVGFNDSQKPMGGCVIACSPRAACM